MSFETVVIGRWACEQCGNRFDREKSGSRPIRFCEPACYQAWRKESNITTGQFYKGRSPWNKNLKGIHLSPSTEWKRGHQSDKELPVGSETVRRRNREKHARAFIKVGAPNTWKARAVVVWERHYGAVPAGMVIHHRDRNPLNDHIINLQAMTRREHAREHSRDRRLFEEPAPKAVQEVMAL